MHLSLYQDDEYDLSWWVPLTFTDPKSGFNNTYSKLWLEPDAEAKQVAQMPDSDSPVIFNVQQTGFYRCKEWQKSYIISC